METGSELSRVVGEGRCSWPRFAISKLHRDEPQTVATFIIQKILLDDNGLQYICATAERFYAVSTVLGNMVEHQLAKQPTLCR